MNLPLSSHFARHCSSRTLSNNGERVLFTAFEPSNSNPNISGCWLEYFQSKKFEENLELVRKDLSASGRKIRKSHKIAVILHEIMKNAGDEQGVLITLNHVELENFLSHAEVSGIPIPARMLQEKIARQCQTFPALPSEV